MTDKPDTNLPGSKPEAGGVEGEGRDTGPRAHQAPVSGFMEDRPNDARKHRSDGNAARLDAEALARMNAFY